MPHGMGDTPGTEKKPEGRAQSWRSFGVVKLASRIQTGKRIRQSQQRNLVEKEKRAQIKLKASNTFYRSLHMWQLSEVSVQSRQRDETYSRHPVAIDGCMSAARQGLKSRLLRRTQFSETLWARSLRTTTAQRVLRWGEMRSSCMVCIVIMYR